MKLREKIADVRLAGITGRRNDSAHSFMSLMSGLCPQSLVSSLGEADRYCCFSLLLLLSSLRARFSGPAM